MTQQLSARRIDRCGQFRFYGGAPGGTRTRDLGSTNHLLYPAELRTHHTGHRPTVACDRPGTAECESFQDLVELCALSTTSCVGYGKYNIAKNYHHPRKGAHMTISNMDDRHAYKPETMLEWMLWKGDGPPPASWYAVNPKTGENTKIYRSYADYCDD